MMGAMVEMVTASQFRALSWRQLVGGDLGVVRASTLGRRQDTREASRLGTYTEGLWLHNARCVYRELGEDLDVLSSGAGVDDARLAEATVRLRKLSEVFWVRGREPQKTRPALIEAITLAIDSSDSRTRHGKRGTWDAEPQVDLVRIKIRLVDQRLGELLERDLFHQEQPLTKKLSAVLTHWRDDTPASRKWPLLRELLGAFFPGEDIPSPKSLRTTFQRRDSPKA